MQKLGIEDRHAITAGNLNRLSSFGLARLLASAAESDWFPGSIHEPPAPIKTTSATSGSGGGMMRSARDEQRGERCKTGQSQALRCLQVWLGHRRGEFKT
jgi:hypothetical protein